MSSGNPFALPPSTPMGVAAVRRLLSPGMCQHVLLRVHLTSSHPVLIQVNKAQVRRMLHDDNPRELDVTLTGVGLLEQKRAKLTNGKPTLPYRMVVGR